MMGDDTFDDDLDLLDSLLGSEDDEDRGGIAARGLTYGPLSFQQDRLWFLNELTTGAAAYTICSAYRLRGALNVEALQAALQTLVTRQASLRTAFRNRPDGGAEQYIAAAYAPLTDIHDLTARGETDIPLQALQNEAARPFDLTSGRPFRATLFTLGETHHVLTLSLHHIISDAWSLGILMGETAALYDAQLRGETAALRPLPVSYLDYAAWQRERSPSQASDDLAYWQRTLADLPLLDLPTDLPRPPMQTFNGATCRFDVPRDTVRGLQALATRERTTLFSVLMAALQVLLSRHARQTDIAIGTSVAGRDQTEIEGLIGFFTKMLVIRGDLGQDPSFRTLIRHDSDTIRDALDHTTLSYDQLVEALNVPRDPSRNPLFQVAFTLLGATTSPPTLGDIDAEPLLSQDAARFDLELFFHTAEDTLSGTFVYNTDLFVEASVQRLIEQMQVLLADAVARPDTPVSRLSLMATPPALVAPEAGALPLPIHAAFLAHAAEQPEAVALRWQEQTLSYGALADHATRIAHQLRRAGVRADQPVGLWFTPGFSMIAAMLGTWMAGGGYVPLDPASPAERVNYILENSGVQVVVSEARHIGALPLFAGQVIDIDAEDDAEAASDTLPEVVPGQLAYIIYTSGSTGWPKGVEISHANAARLFTRSAELFAFDRDDVWTFFHSYAFDFSVWEIWGALVTGASLVIVPSNIARETDAFYDLLCDEKVTVLSQTPSAFRQLMAAEARQPREADLALRYLVFGGEALEIGSLWPWVDRHGDNAPVLVNMYGITETTVHVTFRRVTYGDVRRATGSVIGAPLPDLAIQLLDPNGLPVPAGMTGEIYVEGAGVARGYRHNPALTAARFVPGANGARLYRSGDLARVNARGELEYRGRTDAQVKLRGYRIEIGEIESALKGYPAVADAVVIVRDAHDAARLVAYVRLRDAVDTAPTLEADDWLPSFDMIYTEAEAEDDELDLVGWNNSYDNQPLPAEHMRQWRDEILARLRALTPRRILELGTGSGMLLLPFAGTVERYHGLDFSAAAVARLTRKVADRGYQQVQLEHREARDQAGLPGDFDLVVLNSTAQYFPSADYFIDVLDQALQRLQPGGRLFVGDLRHLGLLRHFHASCLVHRRPDDGTRGALRQQLDRLIAGEKELLVDPAFFAHWAAARGNIADIQILPKVCGGDNELTTYRYDVIIETGTPRAAMPYQEATADEAVFDGQPLLIRDVPNPRLAPVDAFLTWLDAEEDPATVAADEEWAAWAQMQGGDAPVALMAAWQAQAEATALYWASGEQIGRFDVAVAADPAQLQRVPVPVSNTDDLKRFFNVPSTPGDQHQLTAALRQHLSTRLPSYMLPGAFVVMDDFPLTVNGKLDVKALPAPGENVAAAASDDDAELSATEHKVGAIWAEVLQLPRLGRHANFFESGGHSLLATQVVSRLRNAFATELPLRSLFDNPTIAELAALLDEQAPSSEEAPALPAITPAVREGALPLSFAQQRFWFMEQVLQGDISYYNISLGLRLQGALNMDALQQALTAIVARHEALRTQFVQQNGVPVQEILASWTPTIAQHDYRDRSPTDVDAALAAQAYARFDMAAAPPMRMTVVQVGTQEHILQLTLHHAISDGWSLGVMVREFSALYTAFAEGTQPQLPDLPIQFADVAVWQRRELSGARLDTLLAQWTQRLEGAPATLALPFERAPEADTPRRGKVIHFTLDKAQTQRLKRFADTNGATLFMVLAAGYAALLERYTEAGDVVIGTPIANRQRNEMEHLIGCFLNTLALRIQQTPDMNGRTLLAHVRERVLEAYEWQDAPFEAVVGALQPERSQETHALFQVMLVLQNMPLGALQLPGLEVEPMRSEDSIADFDLSLSFIEADTEDGASVLQGMLEYDANAFEHAPVDQFAAQLVALLDGMATAPEQPLSAVNLLAPHERTHLVYTLNDTHHALPPQRCLHERVAEQAARTPSRTAVRSLTGTLSYAELEARANGVAQALHAQGIGPDDIVGLCVERDLGMVVGMLGILKAGAAYLPLDPAYPQERLDFMLEDARARALLTQDSVRASVSFAGPTLLIEALGEAAESPDSGVLPEHLAYVIYTSGSTGTPKGVMTPHAGIINYLSWSQSTFLPGGPGTIPMTHSFAFDGCMNLLFGSLIGGYTMLLLPRDDVLTRLRHVLERGESVPFIDCMPSHLEALQHVLDPTQLAGQVQAITAGGEALQASTLAFWRRHAPDTRLYNEYGPTEATVGCCTYEVTPASPWQGPLPIGRPIWNTRVYVLDEHMQPLPTGLAGDLYVAGDGLARGYLHQPALTAQRFIPDPFTPGGRLYRTGDRVRWRSDDTLEYLGRDDHQVKLRGFRIELGEIEDALRQHPLITDAVVTVHDAPDGARRLVGYVIGEGESLPPDLEAFLQGRLPAYMVPAQYMKLAAWPMLVSGKVNRRALPPPDVLSLRDDESVLEPGRPFTAMEQRLAAIWADALGHPVPHPDVDFFDVGGDSLMAVKLVYLIEREFGRALALSSLFTERTLAAQAVALATQRGRAEPQVLVPIRERNTGPSLLLVHDISGQILSYQPLAEALPAYGCYGLQALAPEQGGATSVDGMAQAYADAIIAAALPKPWIVVGHSFGGQVAGALARVLTERGHSPHLLAVLEGLAESDQADLDQLPEDDLALMAYMIRTVEHSMNCLIDLDAAQLEALSPDTRAPMLAARLAAAGVVPEGTPPEQVMQLFAIYKNNLESLRHYRPGRITCPMAVWRTPTLAGQGDLGWQAYADRPVAVLNATGEHVTMLKPPHVQALAQHLVEAIRAQEIPS